jgi:hypothetical protein
MNLVALALDDLTGAETFPLDALMTLRQKWSEARAPLLAALDAYASGADRSEENGERVFFALHLLAEKRETAAFAPLLKVAHEGAPLYDMVGDATTETLPNIFISLFDGDLEKLFALIEAPGAEEWARVAAMETYAFLAASGGTTREAAQEKLAFWFENLQPRADHPVWYGWQGCVALLGLHELEPLAARAFRQGLIDKKVLAFDDFQADLHAAKAGETPLEAFVERGLGPIDDVMETLAVFDMEEPEPEEPVENKFKNVGRNDLCPCGSGKKFKKCCLGVE